MGLTLVTPSKTVANSYTLIRNCRSPSDGFNILNTFHRMTSLVIRSPLIGQHISFACPSDRLYARLHMSELPTYHNHISHAIPPNRIQRIGLATTNRTHAGPQFLEALPMSNKASKQGSPNAYLLMIRLCSASIVACGAYSNFCLRPIHDW